MIEHWLRSIRDHPKRPPALQRHALAMLALRLDDRTGCGFASVVQVMADADASKATVKRATRWGRDHKFLVQTKRGHRVSAERVVASEWRLALPAQGLMGEPLADPRAQYPPPKGSPVTPHQESVSINGSRARGEAAHSPERNAIIDRWVAGEISTEEKQAAIRALRRVS